MTRLIGWILQIDLNLPQGRRTTRWGANSGGFMTYWQWRWRCLLFISTPKEDLRRIFWSSSATFCPLWWHPSPVLCWRSRCIPGWSGKAICMPLTRCCRIMTARRWYRMLWTNRSTVPSLTRKRSTFIFRRQRRISRMSCTGMWTRPVTIPWPRLRNSGIFCGGRS